MWPAFTVVDATTPWLLRVRSKADLSLEATLTDLCGHYCGRLDAAIVENQIKKWGAHDAREMVEKLRTCLEGGERLSEIRVRRLEDHEGDEGGMRLEWVLKNESCLSFACLPSAEPAALLRDEVELALRVSK